MIDVENQLYSFLGDDYEVINSGFCVGQYNMDFDIERTKQFSEGNAKAMFRVYGWKPWALSLGYNQKETDIDPELCKARNIDIVRRPTGGRAVLHANELTYSVVCPIPEGISPQDLYRDIHIFLLEGLNKLAIPDLGFEKSQPDFRNLYKREDRSVSCFASSARWEISCQGKKMVGSAQRVFGNTLLQHGSIILSAGHEQLADIITTDSDEKRTRLKAWTLEHSIAADEAAGRIISYDETAEAILSIFK